MDPETLVTFHFHSPPGTHTVELLGSWDNFTHPYPMHRDRRRGSGCWTGCFKFHDIVYDGPAAATGAPSAGVGLLSKPRTGGLLQGGQYWYFFVLDSDRETYDDSISSRCTADCPLMPGQTMNFLSVPTEIVERPRRCWSVCAEEGLAGTLGRMDSLFGSRNAASKQTLDPADKFAMLKPQPSRRGGRVHERCVSDLELDRRREITTGSRAPARSPLPPGSDKDDAGARRPVSRGWMTERRPVSRHSSISVLSAEAHPDPLRSLLVEVEDLRDSDPSNHAFDFDPPSGLSPSTSSQRSPHHQTHSTSSAASFRSAPAQPLIPPTEHEEDAIYSPTFSAATLSDGGINTPFRLSVEAYQAAAGDTGDLPERLQGLRTSPQHSPEVLGTRSRDWRAYEHASYALPLPAMESVHSVGKLSSPSDVTIRGAGVQVALPALHLDTTVAGTRGGSMMDEIFSELGYLGGCIS